MTSRRCCTPLYSELSPDWYVMPSLLTSGPAAVALELGLAVHGHVVVRGRAVEVPPVRPGRV